MSHLANKNLRPLEYMALQVRAARERRLHVSMDDLLTAIDRLSDEPVERIVERAFDIARARQAIEIGSDGPAL